MTTKPATIRRILVALDASPHSFAALEAAAHLAAHLEAELSGLYVEDENLLRGAELPITRMVGSFSGEVRPVERGDMEQQLNVQAARARRALEQIAVPSGDYGCETCGYDAGLELELKVSFANEPDVGPDACPRCGRPMILRLEFDEPPARRVGSQSYGLS